ncbi:MAG: UDP-2,4-diacetamido-2,4,6-trideoxy-beta-L-altropyranose hydrolase [Bacteroidota bacterium]
MKVLFRLDAGKKSGLGHLSRNIAIANALKRSNINSFFLIKSDAPSFIEPYLKNENFENEQYSFLPYELTSSKDIHCIKKTYNEGFSFLIVDHYNLNISSQQKLKESGIKWAQFDHKAKQKILADIVINSNVSLNKDHYQKLTNKNTELCIGYKYVILQEKFRNQITHPEKKRILIAFGGAEYPNKILKLISFLTSHNAYTFDIVSGDNRLPNISYYKSNINLHINSNDVKSIYKKCEAAVVAGGVTTYELAALNIPMFIVPFVQNQKNNAKALDFNNFGINFSNTNNFINALKNKGLDILLKELFSKTSTKNLVIDGLGADRISEKIKNKLTNSNIH